jgi:hypothetical protein
MTELVGSVGFSEEKPQTPGGWISKGVSAFPFFSLEPTIYGYLHPLCCCESSNVTSSHKVRLPIVIFFAYGHWSPSPYLSRLEGKKQLAGLRPHQNFRNGIFQ